MPRVSITFRLDFLIYCRGTPPLYAEHSTRTPFGHLIIRFSQKQVNETTWRRRFRGDLTRARPVALAGYLSIRYAGTPTAGTSSNNTHVGLTDMPLPSLGRRHSEPDVCCSSFEQARRYPRTHGRPAGEIVLLPPSSIQLPEHAHAS